MKKSIQLRSATYDQGRKGYSSKTIQKILKWNPAMIRNTFLDLGTGTGILAFPLSKYFKTSMGTDISIDRIAYAKRKNADLGKNIKFSVGTGEEITCRNNTVDLVTAAQCFMYFNRKKALTEIKRVLKPNGTLAIVWKYPVVTNPVIDAINHAVRKTNKDAKTSDIKEVRDGSQNVRGESLIQDLSSSGCTRILYNEEQVNLTFSESDVVSFAIHSTGFALGKMGPEIEIPFMNVLKKNLSKLNAKGSHAFTYREHLFLGTFE